MKALKITLYVLGALLALFLILGLIAPKEVETTRSIVINAPQELVFNTVNDLSTWESWSPWKEMDPDMAVTMGEKTLGEGASYSWVGKKSGSGTMSITASQPHSSVNTEVAFEGMGGAQAQFTLAPDENGTQTTWSFHTDFPFPWNGLMMLMNFKKQINKDYDRGLELLKEKVEAMAQATTPPALEVKTTQIPFQYFVGISKKINMADIQAHYTESLAKAHAAVGAAKISMPGMPCGLYYSWDMENQQTELAACVPVAQKSELPGLSSFELPTTDALLVEYYGDYSGLEKAHLAIDDYLAKNKLEMEFPVIEEYVTDPGQEPDPAKWLTRVYYLVKK
ncbi:MAG TPA: SRPBCC family protein [Saprospiraceae bacterium]|nr:SRPBCC family protein [Saprospiraceae bacterium]HMQ82247.1 SRPBCC family protein [Saprospiraceae bacterium]